MRKFIFLLISFLILLPNFVFAECKSDGFTVVYINGIFTEEREAIKDKKSLEDSFFLKTKRNDVNFINGYNATHIEGAGDLISSVIQAYKGASMDYDLITILSQVHNELNTIKILLVGHSQGTFYTNSAYNYLIKNGVPKDSVSVYNLATPADYVAGGGNYLTSSNDKVINEVVRDLISIGFAKKPLPANIDIAPGEGDQDPKKGGHSLSKTYLAGAPDKIIGDMQDQLNKLSVPSDYNNVSEKCFETPKTGLTYNLKNIGFLVGDKTANGIVFLYNGSIAVGKFAYNTGKQLVFSIKEVFAKTFFWGAALTVELPQNPLSPPTQSIQGLALDEQESDIEEDILNNTLSVVLVDNQDQIDDILEKIDLLRRQITDLELAQLLDNQNQSQNNNQIQLANQTQNQNTSTYVVYTGGGGSSNPVYSKILISEIQIGSQADSKEEFVELYNPNNFDVDLTSWYIHRKTKSGSDYSTFVANNLFSGKKITANGYFLITRQDYFTNLADIFIDNPLTEDNSLILKNPNGEIVDKVGWGEAQDFENLTTQNHTLGQSIGRKNVLGEDRAFLNQQDTDNNFNDFELNIPTPKAPNQTYIAPTPPAPQKILINEIQIDSKVGVGGTDDDWVELYNHNEEDVSLKGWSIQKHSSDDPCSVDKSFYKKNFDDNAKITAKGFFLIVGTKSDDLLKNISDMTAGWSLTDNNTVYLVGSQDEILGGDDKNIVDKVGFGVNSCFPETASALAIPDGKSIERKKLGLDTDNNFEDFKISDEPSPKGTFPKTSIEDATDYSLNLSVNSPGAPFYNILIKWQSLATNIDYFQVQKKLNNGDWSDWLPQTNKTEENFTVVYSLAQDNVYYFRARAKDKDLNLGDWSKEIIVDLTNPVVINEVAYAGTNASLEDQWIELYNNSEKDVDLSGYKIVSGTGKIDSLNFTLTGVIRSKEYFILERNDDSLSDIAANQIFDGKIGSNYLYLRGTNNRYVDQFHILSSGLFDESFIKDGNHYSMERVSAHSFGLFDKNWKFSQSNFNGKDKDGNQIYGTPGQKNSVNQMYTYYDFSFIENTFLKKDFNPYLFKGDVQIFKNVKLEIEPGVIIKFYENQSKLTVKGTLKAIGTDSEKIIFTSFYDDEFGGDSNESSGTLDLPSLGNWLGLYFSPDSQNSELENVVIRYGGAIFSVSPFTWGNVLWVDGSSISLKNSILEKSKNRGLRMIKSNSIIDSVQFLDFNTTDWPYPDEAKAIFIQGGVAEIKNSVFKNNYYGIYIDDWKNPDTGEIIKGDPVLENNQFEGIIKKDIYNVNPPPPPPPPPPPDSNE